MKRFVQCSLLLAAMLWGCVRDTDEIRLQEGIPFTVGEARSWFETYGEPEYRTGLSAFRATDSSYVELEPLLDWDLAELQEDSTWTVVELPWEYENGFVTMATPEMNCCQESLDEQKSSQVIRLVVMKNKTTDDIYGFKMVVIPDLNYLTMGGDQILSNTYLSRETDFYGLVMFYSIGGKFVNGWQYADGQIIAKINESDMEQDPSGMDGTRSSISWEYIEIETCYYHSVSIDGGITWSGARLSGCSYSYYAVMHVDYSDYNGGGIGGYYPAGGGGGGSGSTTVSPPVTILNNKLSTLFKGICSLSESDTKKLNEAYEEMLKVCFYGAVDNYLFAHNVKLNSISYGSAGQVSIDSNGNLKFYNSNEINSFNLKHEWIHIFQKTFLNISSFGDMAGMVEFEVALVQDILKFIEIGGNWKTTAHSWAVWKMSNENYKDDYMDWLSRMTNNGTTYPTTVDKRKFQFFSIAFGEVSISYNTNRGYTYGSNDYDASALLEIFIRAENLCYKKIRVE